MTSDREQLRATAVQVRVHLSDKLGDVWWLLLARGLLALALGVAALFWPTATLVLLIRLIAILYLGCVGVSYSDNRERVSAFPPWGVRARRVDGASAPTSRPSSSLDGIRGPAVWP